MIEVSETEIGYMIISPNLIAISSLSVPKLWPWISRIWPPLIEPDVDERPVW